MPQQPPLLNRPPAPDVMKQLLAAMTGNRQMSDEQARTYQGEHAALPSMRGVVEGGMDALMGALGMPTQPMSGTPRWQAFGELLSMLAPLAAVKTAGRSGIMRPMAPKRGAGNISTPHTPPQPVGGRDAFWEFVLDDGTFRLGYGPSGQQAAESSRIPTERIVSIRPHSTLGANSAAGTLQAAPASSTNYYHGTAKQHLQGILKHGIKRARAGANWSISQSDRVYVTNNSFDARTWAREASYRTGGALADTPVVLHLDIPDEVVGQFARDPSSDRFSRFASAADIKPEWIKGYSVQMADGTWTNVELPRKVAAPTDRK